jgi:hypothetical protein
MEEAQAAKIVKKQSGFCRYPDPHSEAFPSSTPFQNIGAGCVLWPVLLKVGLKPINGLKVEIVMNSANHSGPNGAKGGESYGLFFRRADLLVLKFEQFGGLGC